MYQPTGFSHRKTQLTLLWGAATYFDNMPDERNLAIIMEWNA
jgi:hypothetical protein